MAEAGVERMIVGRRPVAASERAPSETLPKQAASIVLSLGPAGTSLVALIIWALSLPGIDARRMTDLGLVSVLTPGVFIALALLTLSFAVALHQDRLRLPVLGLQLGLLILMLYGITALVEEAPRFSVVYRHAGFAEYIMRTGQLNTNIDAYFSWPGFFVLAAFVTKIGALSSVLDLAAWAPVFFNLLWVGPLYMILRAATENQRVVWLGLWCFFVGNWVGQDYLSPQALNYFFYLLVLGVLLTWFRSGSNGVASPAWQRAALMTTLLVVFAAVVSSHPLTPFFAIATVSALVVVRRIRPRALPIVMAAMTAGWVLIVGQPFLAGHTSMVTGSVGDVNGIVSANLTSRVQGSPEHMLVVGTRIAFTLLLWGLAVLGAIRTFGNRHRLITFGVVAIAPLAIIPLQVYGGEIALRAYLFSLPAVVLFVAFLFAGSGKRRAGWGSTVIVGMTSLLLGGAFLVARYGNERIDYVTNAELAGMRQVYKVAPVGSILLSTGYVPWKFQQIEAYDYRYLPADAIDRLDVQDMLGLMTGKQNQRAYFLVTRSEAAQVDLFYGNPDRSKSELNRGALDRLADAMIASGRFSVVYRNTDSLILTVAGGGDSP